MSLEKAIETIQTIYEKYKDDTYMIPKIHHYITIQLPSLFDTMRSTREENIKKIQEKINDQDSFIQNFLNNHSFYYIPSTEKFFYYNGLHYTPYSEDEILHSISRECGLTSWKQRTRISTMKKIKENSLMTTIPNTETIQFVIEMLFPIFFNSKTQTKYFLTILGDNILKKTPNMIYFMNTKAKSFLRELDNYSQVYIGTHLNQTIKHKYHEHDYNCCRLLQINDVIKMEHLWLPIINQYYLDIICVAIHYSNRFSSADNYLITYSNDDSLIQYAFYLKETTPELLIQTFLNEYIQSVSTTTTNKPTIQWKNMQYLWKQFLDAKKLPSVIFQQNLKQLFLENIGEKYDETTDSFIGVFSKYNPTIQKFLQFWDETMIIDEDACELEVDEIIVLFKKWTSMIDANNVSTNTNYKQIIDLISHFYPNVEIENDKFVYKIRSSLWDKITDVRLTLESLQPDISTNFSIYDAYEKYCKEQRKQDKIIVSKYFFEKFMFEWSRDS